MDAGLILSIKKKTIKFNIPNIHVVAPTVWA